jgi:signal peptidase I
MNLEMSDRLAESGAPAQGRGWFRYHRHPARLPSLGRQLAHCLVALGVAAASYFIATHFIFQSVVVDGDSMKPTLHNTDRYVLNRLEYYLRSPKPEDIVVLRDPEDGGLSVKRIIAVQGDKVELAAGGAYVNGVRLNEPYLPRGTRTFSYNVYDHERFVCGQNEYFVLGDNRGNSADSRIYGLVPRKNILGVVSP